MQAQLKHSEPASAFGRPVDLVHLSRQTGGDRALEAEILGMFARQMTSAKTSIALSNADERKRLAHTIRGTAASVGAMHVADIATRMEQAPLNSALVRDLENAIADVLNFIAAINR